MGCIDGAIPQREVTPKNIPLTSLYVTHFYITNENHLDNKFDLITFFYPLLQHNTRLLFHIFVRS